MLNNPNNKLNNLASLGRYGDTMLAHINPQEANLLKSMGGAGTVNPQTGLSEFYNFSQFYQLPQQELPVLAQAFEPNAFKEIAGQLQKITVPQQGFGLATRSAYETIDPELDKYANYSIGGMGTKKLEGYTVPTDLTFQGKPLESKYDNKGNFQYMGLAGGDVLYPDANQPNIAASPRFNKTGGITDYGVFDVNADRGGGFGDFLGGFVEDFGPMILAGLGANLAAGNLNGLFGSSAATGGATAADIAANNMLANANMANYAGLVSDAGIPMAGVAPGAAASDLLAQANLQYAGATPVNYGTVTGTPLGNLGGEVVSTGSPFSVPTGQAGVDAAARVGADSAATIGGASATDIKAHEALAGANAAAQASGSLTPSAAGAGAGSFLSNLLPKTPAEIAALASGLGSVVSGVVGANAAEKAAQTQADAATKAAQLQQEMFNTINAQGAPYRASGYNALNQIGSMLPGQYSKYDASGKLIGQDTGTGYFTQQYGPEQFQKDIDPGYAFRLQQGQMANQRASNLAGGLIGGNAIRGMQDYTQGMASQEYGNAFNRFQTQRGNIYNTLAGIAGIGQTAQGQANQLAQNNAIAQGQLGVGSAAAIAAGQIGQANAYGGAATGAGNAYLLSQLLKQNQGVALT
jgi:hypothetical protein